jgi:hypothetical protein
MTIKIYKISSVKGDKVYIGSTTKHYLCTRKADHLSKYRLKKGRRCASYDLFDEYGVEYCVFELLEEFTEDQHSRFEREKYWIEQHPTSVNCNRPIMTKDEEKKMKHDWYIADKKANPEKYNARKHADYEKCKDERKIQETCECGLVYTRGHKKRHEQTKRHMDLLNLTDNVSA